jgi:hypothetical protein
VEYFKYLSRIITNDTKRKQEIESRIAKGRATLNNNNNNSNNNNENLFTSKLGLILRNMLEKYYIRSITKLDTSEIRSEILEIFEILCLRRKASLTHRVKNEEGLKGVNEGRNIVQTIKRRKAN